MKGNKISFNGDVHHPVVTKLIAATESGDAAKVRKLLKRMPLSGARATVASLVLGAVDPMHTTHKAKKKRLGKRSLQSAWKRIARSICLLVDAGADPDTVDQIGQPVLCIYATYRNRADILRRLLSAGADPNSHTPIGDSAIYLAVIYRNEEGVRLLLEYGADPGVRYDEENTLLMFAAANQQFGILRRLINAGVDLDCRDKYGRSALMHNLHRHGEFPFLVMYRWAREADARQYPRKASISITQLLIESGAEYHHPDRMGFTPVDYALVAHLNGVELPVELTVDQTHLTFCAAAMAGDSAQLAALLESEGIPTRITSIALTLVAVRGFEKCCAILLENGADANKVNPCGISPAKAAATGLQLPIIKLLVAGGLSKDELNVALTDVCMALPYHYEHESRSTFHAKKMELARYLLEQGADPNRPDKDFDDLLTIATLFEKNVELVRLLVEFGAVARVANVI